MPSIPHNEIIQIYTNSVKLGREAEKHGDKEQAMKAKMTAGMMEFKMIIPPPWILNYKLWKYFRIFLYFLQ